MEYLFQNKHQDTENENNDWRFGVMMFFEAMRQRVQPDHSGECDHKIFEKQIFDQIFSE